MKKRNRPKSFEILVTSAVSNFPVGWHRSLLKGSGDEFECIRHWQPGDKRIAMAASAKSGEVMSKVFQEPKQMNIWLALDTSRSMIFGGQQPAIEAEAVIAAAFILSAKKVGDLVAVIAFDSEVRWCLALGGALSIREISQRLLNYRPPRGRTNLSAALQWLVDCQPRNGLVVLISDFWCPLARKDINLLRQLSSFNDISVLALMLNQGEALIGLRRQRFLLTVEDSEANENLIWANSPTAADALGQAIKKSRRRVKRLLGIGGAECLPLILENDYVRQLSRYFWRKRRYRV